MKLIDREVVLDIVKRLAADVCNDASITAMDVLSEINDVVLEAPFTDDIEDLSTKVKRYEETVGKLIVRGDEVVGILNGHETVYIQKDIAKVMRNLARRNAINEFYDDINVNVGWNTLEGKSDEYMGGYYDAVAWYNEMVLKAKNEMLGEHAEETDNA